MSMAVVSLLDMAWILGQFLLMDKGILNHVLTET